MKTLVAIGLAMVCAVAYSDEAKSTKKSDATKQVDAVKEAKQAERRAMRMVKNALSLMAEKEEDRALNMLEAVPRMYPTSQARYSAYLELGRHFINIAQTNHEYVNGAFPDNTGVVVIESLAVELTQILHISILAYTRTLVGTHLLKATHRGIGAFVIYHSINGFLEILLLGIYDFICKGTAFGKGVKHKFKHHIKNVG